MNETQMNMSDGWGEPDDALTSDVWDDYAQSPIADDDDADDYDPQLHEDRAALETEIADAIRRGDDDAIDQAAEELAQVNTAAAPRTVTKPKRKSGWKPPPQCGVVAKTDETDFKPLHKMWKKPTAFKFGKGARKAFPTLAETARQPDDESDDDDILRLASLKSGKSDGQISGTTPKPDKVVKKGGWRKLEMCKVGAMGHKEQKHNEYVERRKSGNETAREKRGRENNEKRAAMFAKVSEAHTKSASERAKELGWVRTAPCRSVGTGKPCPHGARCRFAHKPEELGVKRCHFGERCRKKGHCRFPHTDEEVAAALAKARAHMTSLMCKA